MSLRKFSEKLRIQILAKYLHNSIYMENKEKDSVENHRLKVMSKGLPKKKSIEDVKHIILIASSKGGVGKSTTAVNLAVAMKTVRPNKKVALLDADVFGPSLPVMMNLNDTPLSDGGKMLPLQNYGIKCMSMGFLIEKGSPVIWRGLMVMQALEKLMRGVKWGSVDYLLIDTPPGTGDTHLSLIQNLPFDGVVLVTTPHNVSIEVTKRGANMFTKLNVPIIGLVENMSTMECPKCSNKIHLFGNTCEQLSRDIGASILQHIPLETDISLCCNRGVPIVIAKPESASSYAYLNLAKNVLNFIDKTENNAKS